MQNHWSQYLLNRISCQRDSVFRVLEPVVEKINEKTKARHLIRSIFSLRFKPSEWFRVYRVGTTTTFPLIFTTLSSLIPGLLFAL